MSKNSTLLCLHSQGMKEIDEEQVGQKQVEFKHSNILLRLKEEKGAKI